jgi:hypothetical protein
VHESAEALGNPANAMVIMAALAVTSTASSLRRITAAPLLGPSFWYAFQ